MYSHVTLSCLVSDGETACHGFFKSCEENETGYRGFRKRWRDGASVASVANSESGMSIIDGADAIPLDLDLDAGGSQFGSNLGSEDYEPSIRPESAPVTGSVQVVASGSSEFGWRCEALRSAVDRTRLYGDTFAWEKPDFGGVFQKPDLFSGTIVSGYKLQAFFCTYFDWSDRCA